MAASYLPLSNARYPPRLATDLCGGWIAHCFGVAFGFFGFLGLPFGFPLCSASRLASASRSASLARSPSSTPTRYSSHSIPIGALNPGSLPFASPPSPPPGHRDSLCVPWRACALANEVREPVGRVYRQRGIRCRQWPARGPLGLRKGQRLARHHFVSRIPRAFVQSAKASSSCPSRR